MEREGSTYQVKLFEIHCLLEGRSRDGVEGIVTDVQHGQLAQIRPWRQCGEQAVHHCQALQTALCCDSTGQGT